MRSKSGLLRAGGEGVWGGGRRGAQEEEEECRRWRWCWRRWGARCFFNDEDGGGTGADGGGSKSFWAKQPWRRKKIKSISNFLVGSDTRVDNPTSQPDDQRQAGTSCSELSDCQKTVTNIKCAWWWCVCLFGQTQLLVVDKDLIEFFYHHTISGNEERPKEKLD